MTMKGTSHPRAADLNDHESSAGGRAWNCHVPTGRTGEMTKVEEPDLTLGERGEREMMYRVSQKRCPTQVQNIAQSLMKRL